jgi:hypothetical protein
LAIAFIPILCRSLLIALNRDGWRAIKLAAVLGSACAAALLPHASKSNTAVFLGRLLLTLLSPCSSAPPVDLSVADVIAGLS